MKTSKIFYNTLLTSVIIQFVTGLFEIGTLFIHVKPSIVIIRQLMILELIVQIIEGLFYVWLLFHFSTEYNITPKRYVDWSITTPTMLITLIIYLIYLDYKERGLDTSTLDFFQLLSQNSTNITYILSLNWLMLLFGYLAEIKLLDTISGVILGFIPFLIYYFIIYINYAYRSKNGWKFFMYFFFFWSLYGIAALMPYNIKNACYNILDIFSKNFFGVFLSYILITQSFSNY
jgi:hypothetical protein